MATRAEGKRGGMVRNDLRAYPGIIYPGQAQRFNVQVPFRVEGTKTFVELKTCVQQALDDLQRQVNRALNELSTYVQEATARDIAASTPTDQIAQAKPRKPSVDKA